MQKTFFRICFSELSKSWSLCESVPPTATGGTQIPVGLRDHDWAACVLLLLFFWGESVFVLLYFESLLREHWSSFSLPRGSLRCAVDRHSNRPQLKSSLEFVSCLFCYISAWEEFPKKFVCARDECEFAKKTTTKQNTLHNSLLFPTKGFGLSCLRQGGIRRFLFQSD